MCAFSPAAALPKRQTFFISGRSMEKSIGKIGCSNGFSYMDLRDVRS